MSKLQKRCFIASTIGETGSDDRKIADDKFDLVYQPILKNLGYEAIRADKIGAPNSISNDIVRMIIDSEQMIADVSDHNPNVFYELAVRNSINKPVIVVKGVEQKMPFDVYDKRAISIDMTDARNWTEGKNMLEVQIKESEKDPENASKSILTDFSLASNLQINSNPDVDLKLDLKEVKNQLLNLQNDLRDEQLSIRQNTKYLESREVSRIFRIRRQRSEFMRVLQRMEGAPKLPVSLDILLESLMPEMSEYDAMQIIHYLLNKGLITEPKRKYFVTT